MSFLPLSTHPARLPQFPAPSKGTRPSSVAQVGSHTLLALVDLPFFSSRNGVSLGTAFENLSRGLGMAYFPAISLSFKESVAFNFGSRPLRYRFGTVVVGGLASM